MERRKSEEPVEAVNLWKEHYLVRTTEAFWWKLVGQSTAPWTLLLISSHTFESMYNYGLFTVVLESNPCQWFLGKKCVKLRWSSILISLKEVVFAISLMFRILQFKGILKMCQVYTFKMICLGLGDEVALIIDSVLFFSGFVVKLGI